MTDFVRGKNHTPQAKFTRPADTAIYAAGDVIADSTSAPNIMTFTRSALEDGSAGGQAAGGIIQEAILTTSANQATKPDLELWLFDTTVVMDNDNAVFTPTDAEMLTLVTVIAFPSTSFKVGDATVGAGGNAACDVQNIGVPFNIVGTNNTALFGILVVRNAYTPVSGEVFAIRLKVLD